MLAKLVQFTINHFITLNFFNNIEIIYVLCFIKINISLKLKLIN